MVKLFGRIDEVELLNLLRENARCSYVELAVELGVSEAAVRKKMKLLEKKGVIKGYTLKES